MKRSILKKSQEINVLERPIIAEELLVIETQGNQMSKDIQSQAGSSVCAPVVVQEYDISPLNVETVIVTVDDTRGKIMERDRPLCKYGKDCYRKNADHLKQYRHPRETGKNVLPFNVIFESKNNVIFFNYSYVYLQIT